MSNTISFPKKLRVVFTGHSGILKQRVVDRFREHLEQRLAAQGDSRKIVCAGVEDELEMSSFLQLEDRLQRMKWMPALHNALETCRNADYAFLSLHLSFRNQNRFISPFSWRGPLRSRQQQADTLVPSLRNLFKPDYCVCLIDDIQAAQQRIGNGAAKIHLRLNELLAWRNIESVFTDVLGQETTARRKNLSLNPQFPFERSPVISNRQSREMLLRYLCMPQIPRIYASYPITRVRYHTERREEIDDFRSALAARFCVFDPVTIDELPLEALRAEEAPKGATEATLPASSRWPLETEQTLVGTPIEDCPGVRMQEVEEITQLIEGRDRTTLDSAVEERDLRLVDQSDCVVVYRPQYSTGMEGTPKYHTPTEGTAREMDYALKIAERKVFVVHDSAVDGSLRRGPLQHFLPNGNQYFVEVPNLSDPKQRAAAFTLLVSRIESISGALASRRAR